MELPNDSVSAQEQAMLASKQDKKKEKEVFPCLSISINCSTISLTTCGRYVGIDSSVLEMKG